MKKILTKSVVFFILISLLTSCTLFKSDEKLIEDRVNSFLSAYNSGDLEAVIENLDTKTRNTYQSAINVTNNIGGGLLSSLTGLGMGLNLSDLFGVSVGTMSDEDLLSIDIEEINIEEDNATVNVTMSYKDKAGNELTEEACFTMLKEDGDWYIKDFKDR